MFQNDVADAKANRFALAVICHLIYYWPEVKVNETRGKTRE